MAKNTLSLITNCKEFEKFQKGQFHRCLASFLPLGTSFIKFCFVVQLQTSTNFQTDNLLNNNHNKQAI